MRALALALALALAGASAEALPPGSLAIERVASDAVAQNLLGEPSDIEVAVYTPPGYAESDARYPVLYLLHGIGGTFRDWTGGGYQGLRLQRELDALIQRGAISPMIVVMPTAMNRYLGSFYADSPVTGNWGTFIARELVAWVEANYRTLAIHGGRGIAGHSMGGFGALALVMEHPDVFAAAYAMSPCCLKLTGDLGAASSGWAAALSFRDAADVASARNAGALYPIALLGLLSVAAPNPKRPPFYVDFPFRVDAGGVLVRTETAYSRYRSYFAVERLGDAAIDALRSLRALAFDTGDKDQFSHIQPGAVAFSERLSAHGVPHRFELYEGDHRNRVRKRLNDVVLPFFARHLDRSRR